MNFEPHKPVKPVSKSPCSFYHSNLEYSIGKENRFSYGSIYNLKEESLIIKKKKKENVYTLIKKMKEEYKELVQDQKKMKLARKRIEMDQEMKVKREIVHHKVLKNYDRYGIISGEGEGDFRVTKYQANFGAEGQNSKITHDQTFYRAKRFDYSKPLNFNPGPGHYSPDIARDFLIRSGVSSKQRLKLMQSKRSMPSLFKANRTLNSTLS